MEFDSRCLLGLDEVHCVGCYFWAEKCQYSDFLRLSHKGLALSAILAKLGLHMGDGEDGSPQNTLKASSYEAPA